MKELLAERAKRGEKPVQREIPPTIWAKLTKKRAFFGSDRSVFIIRLGLAMAGVVLFVFGILNGGMADVLTKAINICTQCIGLG